MRLPKKPGFKSHAPKTEVVQTGQLIAVKKAVVDASSLFEAGVISSPYNKIKLIVGGAAPDKIKEVRLPAASAQAIEIIMKAGGSFVKTDRLPRPKKISASDS